MNTWQQLAKNSAIRFGVIVMSILLFVSIFASCCQVFISI